MDLFTISFVKHLRLHAMQKPSIFYFLGTLEIKHRQYKIQMTVSVPIVAYRSEITEMMYEPFFGMEHTPFVCDVTLKNCMCPKHS